MTSIPHASAVTPADHAHLSLATTYSRGCRCTPCRQHNAQRIALWRATRPKAPARTVVRQLKVRPTRAPLPRRQGTTLYGYADTLSDGQWARANGYDPATRTYRGAA
jgi:hypothetical protein